MNPMVIIFICWIAMCVAAIAGWLALSYVLWLGWSAFCQYMLPLEPNAGIELEFLPFSLLLLAMAMAVWTITKIVEKK